MIYIEIACEIECPRSCNGLLRLADRSEQSQIPEGYAVGTAVQGSGNLSWTRRGSRSCIARSRVRRQPHFRLSHASKHANRFEIVARLDLEYSHHAEQGIPIGHDSTRSELNFLSNGDDRRTDRPQLAAVGQRVYIRNSQQDIETSGAGRIFVQLSKVVDHLSEPQRPDTGRTNEPSCGVDPMSHRHGSTPK
jgi:hypothetical protein